MEHQSLGATLWLVEDWACCRALTTALLQGSMQWAQACLTRIKHVSIGSSAYEAHDAKKITLTSII